MQDRITFLLVGLRDCTDAVVIHVESTATTGWKDRTVTIMKLHLSRELLVLKLAYFLSYCCQYPRGYEITSWP